MGKLVLPDGTEYHTGADAEGTYPWDEETVKGILVKSVDERRYTLCCAYPADKADVATAADGHRDFASKSALEDAAHNFLRKGGKIGLHHADGTDGAGETVESYLWPGDDWTSPGGYVVKNGDWMLGVVWDEPSWDLVKAGKIGGVSMQGSARRRVPTAEALANLRD